MKLLVAGGDRVDAGKTTFAVGLLEHTDATGYKPRAGNDYWFDHDDVRRAVRAGRLYGTDAARLAGASPTVDDPESSNPIHRLWRPNPAGGSGLVGRADREFLLDRVGETFVANGTVDLPASVRENLPVDDAVAVTSLDELNRVMAQYHRPVLDGMAERIAATDCAVVESYGDVARPLASLEPDAVAVVEPGRVRCYPGRRYAKACRVAAGSAERGQLEERVPSVVELIDHVATVGLPALARERRRDPSAIADAYAPAYETLLTAAKE